MTGWSVRGRRLPALDGLRALAVIAVVAYHLGFGWARGGYLGVDLFFVLSGFLITSLLLEEHEASDRIALGAFWGRRARRLLPALFAMVTVVMAFIVLDGRYGNSAFIATFDLSSLRPQALASLFYVANWQLIATHHSYFAQFSAPSPFQHTWSLAIEEQFYLVWPFLTLALITGGLARRRRVGISTTTLIAVASATLMAVLFVPGADPSRIYYGTDTRIQDLAVGALLAWLTARRPETPPRIERLLAAIAPLALCGLLALMALAGSAVAIGNGADAGGIPSNFMFEGGFLVASVLCAIVIADVRRDGSVLARGLSWRPVVAVGVVSYGIYLWHWPVIVLVTPESTGHGGAELLVERLAIIAVLVVASYFLVELPIRRRWFPPWAEWTLLGVGLAVAIVAVLIGTTPSLVIRSHERAALLRYAPTTPATGSGGVVGTVRGLGPVTAQHPLRVVLIGDSMLYIAGPGVDAALDATGEVRSYNRAFPGWGITKDPSWRGYVRHQVASTHADVALVTTGWDDAAATEHPAAYEQTLRQLVAVAESAGAKAVVFLQYPLTSPLDDEGVASKVASTQRGEVAWNAAVAAMPALEPGRVLYFPIAASVELDGRYSPWIPPPRDPTSPIGTWDRVRRVDGVHLCAPGISLYAAAIGADVSTSFHVPAPAPGWWVDGWQHNEIVASGQEFCPADHPGS